MKIVHNQSELLIMIYVYIYVYIYYLIKSFKLYSQNKIERRRTEKNDKINNVKYCKSY
jgi:hypothetical protein